MMIVGLTGSIAMGKSEVAAVFRQCGIPVFDADREVHALYDSSEGAELLQPLAPQAIVAGKVSRERLSSLVMADAGLLQQLETVVHAEVARRREYFLAQARKQGYSVAILDIPLLFEKGQDAACDITIVVSAPLQRQREWALARPGMTPAKLEMILARQMPDNEKRLRATHVIENDGSLEDLRASTTRLAAKLLEESQP